MTLTIDRALLDRVATRLGIPDPSDLVHHLLARAEAEAEQENDAAIAGLDALFGAYPQFPRDDAP